MANAAVFDLCVVGAGMIGSAAARHASELPGTSVCLIGPEEPQDRHNNATGIFAAHYDEGRITRACDPNPVWASMAQASIKRYKDIEEKSGISFYNEVGTLMAARSNGEYMSKVQTVLKEQRIPVVNLDGRELAAKFPYLRLSANDAGVYEERNAGYISPRRLVSAQQAAAKKQGCRIIHDVVEKVSRVVKNGEYVMRVETNGGTVVESRKVLLAAGAYTDFRQLLPGFRLNQLLCPLTVALAEISEQDAAILRSMPSVIYKGDGHPELHPDFPRLPDGQVSYYMLPPIQYPDGKYYIKLGHFHAAVLARLHSAGEVKRWFETGNKALADATGKFIRSLFKGVEVLGWKQDQCVVVETPNDLPYIDTVHTQLGVATGGNGYAAKSSDEIGRIAATMMLRGWDSDIPRDTFRLRTKSAL
ncbi:N-methyl-L-tryptophan oxidase-like [Mya arenaria]|uniref:N-methyl-L-tryptophan oxidase-like n=1 Tax=Mya arenaria TaxID=6604 RepID=UPI0022E37C4B|nr:N-methyl-L-tryptophan oxidase-like [Mya arenaria]